MITGQGPRAIGFSSPEPMILTVTCTDQARGTFFDVHRPGTDGRRQLLDPGEVFRCRIAAGEADITFGHCTQFRFDPDEGGDDGG